MPKDRIRTGAAPKPPATMTAVAPERGCPETVTLSASSGEGVMVGDPVAVAVSEGQLKLIVGGQPAQIVEMSVSRETLRRCLDHGQLYEGTVTAAADGLVSVELRSAI